MMNVKVDKQDACRVLMSVSVPSDRVRPEYERIVELFATHAKIPGFRPGKAPLKLVEKRFRKDILKETQDRLLPDLYQQAIQEENLQPLAVVGLDKVDCSPEEGFSFQVTVDIPPQFKLPKYQKIPVGAQNLEVTDEDVDNALSAIRKRMSRYEDLESGSAQEEDMVQISYKGMIEGCPVSEVDDAAGQIAEGEDFWIPLVKESPFLPGLNDALVGTAIGASLDADITFPDDYRLQKLAGKKATYNVTVKALRRMQEPELDDAFLKDIGMESLEDLKSRVKEDLEAEKKNAEQGRQRQEVITYLLDHTKMDVPSSQVAEVHTELLRSMLGRMSQSGVTREMLEKHRDEMMEPLAKEAANRVKLTFLAKAIAEAEDLSVSDEDVEAEVKKMAGQYDMPEEKVQAMIAKQESGETRLRSDLLLSKVIDRLLEQAKIK